MFFKLKLFLLFFNLINCKQQQTIDFNIFPTDQLCLICRLIIGYWHNQSGDFNNTEQFKNELQKTCSKLLNETEIEKCKNGINLEKLKELETKSIEKICKLEGFCENEFPIIVNERNQLEHEENVKKYLEIPKVFLNINLYPPRRSTFLLINTNQRVDLLG
ncbi:unnamed protein product [Meloidogyne enterolobii]|uniref:Uncharacterized protein n=1 Tax=Meloidogyne enterolobii TaxID=390850 RepID=A0ACB1ANZ4_MELEN